MKRILLTLAASGLAATGLTVTAPVALAEDAGLSVTIASAGTKKVDVTWADPADLPGGLSGPFDAILVTLDNDEDATPENADRSQTVDDTAPRTVRFEDLNAKTTYYAAVYAIDYTNDGFDIVPGDGMPAGTALGTEEGDYSPLTIKSSALTVLSGKKATISGTLTDDDGDALSNKQVHILRDVYPQFGGSQDATTQTDNKGKWSWKSPKLTENTWFWAEYRDPDGVGGWTARILVEVRQDISVSVAPKLTVKAGKKVTFSGNTHGDPGFLDDAAVKACLQHKEGGKWAKKFCEPLKPNGHYSLSFKPGAKADGQYRVWSGMGPAYADSWSKAKTLTVT